MIIIFKDQWLAWKNSITQSGLHLQYVHQIAAQLCRLMHFFLSNL